MMGFGATVRGPSSSSSSNLSASAPPFTVESSVSKPKSNPLVSINESSPYVSAPPLFLNPNSFSNHDLKVEPFASPYLNPANTDQFFSLYSTTPPFHSSNTGSVSANTDAFNFQYLFDKTNDAVESVPYRSHYVGHVVNDLAPLVSLTETNGDFLSNRERSMGFTGHSFGREYTHTHTPQGCDFWNGEGNVEEALKMQDDVSGHERSTAGSSYLHKDYRLGDYPIARKLDVSHKKDACLMSRESQIQFPGMEANSSNKIGTLSEQSYRSIFGESSGMSSTFDKSRTTMPTAALIAAGYNNAFVPPPNTIYEKEQQLIPDIDSLKDYTTNRHSFYTKKDDRVFDMSSFAKREDLSSKVVDNDYVQHKIPCINVPKAHNSGVGNVTVVTDNLSDGYIPAVDSPCWKGASASRISLSEECEVTNSNYLRKKVEGSNFLDFQGKDAENLSREDNGGSHNENVEQIFDGKETIGKYFPDMESIENKLMSDLTNEPNLKDFPSESCDFISNNQFYLDSALDHGLDNNVSEDTSCLPAKEVAQNTEEIHSAKSIPKMNTQVLVNSICNISELLLFQASTDPTAISEKDCENIRHMISNLDEFLLKKTGQVVDRDREQEQEPVLPVEECTQNHLKDSNTGRFDNLGSCEVNHFSGQDVDKILPGGGDFDSLKDSIICGMKDVLGKNFNSEDERHPQIVLYKSLWLEAESAICAMNIEARYNRMKLELEKSNLFDEAKKSKIIGEEETAATNQDVGVKVPSESSSSDNSGPVLDKSTNGSQIPCKNDVEASVMARFQILKGREDANISTLVEEEDVKKKKKFSYNGGQESVKMIGEYNYSDEMMKVVIEQQEQPFWKGRVFHNPGKSDNSSSSDWEHVLKDDIV